LLFISGKGQIHLTSKKHLSEDGKASYPLLFISGKGQFYLISKNHLSLRVTILPGKWKYEFYINSNNRISSENKDSKIHIFHK